MPPPRGYLWVVGQYFPPPGVILDHGEVIALTPGAFVAYVGLLPPPGGYL